jgi:hypothetical protein
MKQSLRAGRRVRLRVAEVRRTVFGRQIVERALIDERAAAAWLRQGPEECTSSRVQPVRGELWRARKECKSLKRILDRLPRYEFGSYSPGVEEWSRRWQERPDKRVLLYALKDHAGSFFKWAAAINDFTDYAARLVVFQAHPFGYPIDLFFLPHSEEGYTGLLDLVEQADVVHIKDETGFFLGTNGLPADLFTQFNKPIVFTHYGSQSRKYADDPEYAAYVRRFEGRIAMTPDLCFEWFDGLYIPQGIDIRRFRYSWRDGRVLGHSPSMRARKGTTTLMEAVREFDLRLDLIEGLTHEECLRRKASCSLFFDQAGRQRTKEPGTERVIGWYGNSALESAVLGIPTIAHLSEKAFEGATRAGRDIRERCPIINTPLDVAGMRTTIARYLDLSPRERQELSLRTREWIESFHSYQAVGSDLAAVYDAVQLTRCGVPVSRAAAA